MDLVMNLLTLSFLILSCLITGHQLAGYQHQVETESIPIASGSSYNEITNAPAYGKCHDK